jgi:hypothetical protein
MPGERGKREIAIFEFGRRPGEFEEFDREQEPLSSRAPSARKMRWPGVGARGL